MNSVQISMSDKKSTYLKLTADYKIQEYNLIVTVISIALSILTQWQIQSITSEITAEVTPAISATKNGMSIKLMDNGAGRRFATNGLFISQCKFYRSAVTRFPLTFSASPSGVDLWSRIQWTHKSSSALSPEQHKFTVNST